MKRIEEKLNAALVASNLELKKSVVARIARFEDRVLADGPEYVPIVEHNDVILERFQVFGFLGRGGQGTTYLAHDKGGDEWVVVKELRINAIEGWKGVELFEREAQVLEHLEHDQIPKYIDATSFEDKGTVRFVLVQSFVDGEDLGQVINERGQRWTESDAKEFLEKFKPVLRYLHARSTPIVHRDIKPSNIIIDADGVPNLVDFGAVQNALPKTVGGSTIIGTSGYVPLEQYMGRATTASDIYALGATIVHMLSGVAPSDMDVVRGRLHFEKYVTVTEKFENLLARMLEPIDDDRAQTVDDLLPEILETPDVPSDLVAIRQSARRNKLVPIASTSGNVVQFRDPDNNWVEIESREEGQRLDRYVRGFPYETRMVLTADSIRVEHKISPLGWKSIVGMSVIILIWASSGGTTFIFVVLPLLIFAVVRLFRVRSIEVHRALLPSHGVRTSREQMYREVKMAQIGTFPIDSYDGARATHRGLSFRVADDTYEIPMFLDTSKHQYFIDRFERAAQQIRDHEELDPLDIW